MRGGSTGNGEFALDVYPTSIPVSLALTKHGATGDLLSAGAIIKPSFCGPCFGAGDVPANNGLSLRHTTRNFPNREGSKPGEGQFAGVCLMDARSIAATALNGGKITAATDIEYECTAPEYEFDSSAYDRRIYYGILNRDLLITAAILHDIGKTKELSLFPQNDYTDDGQLLGHIMIGAEMVHDAAQKIEGFPMELENQLKHCILAHHGELEYGSPKKPAMVEAVALNLADNADAKMETLTELFDAAPAGNEWIGYNRFFESNIRRTG